MNYYLRGFLYLLTLLYLSSCVPHRAFVASPYEPVLVKKKGDLQVDAGIRPLKYYSLNATAAVSDNMAIRLGYEGYFKLDNINASLIFFKNYTKHGFFVAPSFNYQHNTIKRRIPGFFGTTKEYAYNCKYFSPGLVLGFKIAADPEDPTQQFILKVQYNVVNRYEMYWYQDNASGKQQAFEIIDNESLNQAIPNFLSFEPSYAFLYPLAPFLSLKFQLGATICQQTYKHSYSFSDQAYGPRDINASRIHPFYFPVNFGLGIIFNASAKEKKRINTDAFN